jgi:hypothetical protein
VAQKAATLIDPTAAELENILPTSPQLGEKIVFLTDTYTVKQCSKCPEQTVMPKDALQQAVVRLYGQSAGGQIRSQDLISFSSTEVKAMLEKTTWDNEFGILFAPSTLDCYFHVGCKDEPA